MLEQLLDFTQHYKKVHVLYDVACSLSKHLEVRFKIINILFHFYNKQNQGRHDLNKFFEFAVPVFHAYGHKVDCQVRSFK